MSSVGPQNGNNSKLRILHLSDIHFQEPYCLNPDTDPERSIRRALVNDIRSLSERLGSVDAILISGDIAYKGHPEEYRFAYQWLLEICKSTGCPTSSVYTVPGNHDVSRKSAGGRKVLGVRKLISDRPPGPERDKELHDSLLDSESGPEMFVPMENYNRFAASFGCDLDPNVPFWIEDLPLAHGWILRMNGLTTTFFSGPDNDNPGDLYLGSFQRSFPSDDGIVHLAMLHHPPSWLGDSDEIDDSLNGSCVLHLMGHKHRQRYLATKNWVRFSAGAVNPSRAEGSWEPGYNIIELQILNNTERPTLRIQSHLRIWQANPDRFVSKQTEEEEKVFVEDIILRNRPLPAESNAEMEQNVLPKEVPRIMENTSGAQNVVNDEGGSAEGPVALSQRDVVFKFWTLTASQRRKTMQTLNLIEQSDDSLSEPQRYRNAFKRAQERNLFKQLEVVINELLQQSGGK